jgi:CRISPR system Cascade subunit CasC
MTFITCHIINTLPLHNLNRDQNGLPKSAFDGSVQRARLSAQSLKRPARTLYRDSVPRTGTAMRTRGAVEAILDEAAAYAQEQGSAFDAAVARKQVTPVVAKLTTDETKADDALNKALTTRRRQVSDQTAKDGLTEEDAEALIERAEKEVRAEHRGKKTIVFLARSEIATMARELVEAQNAEDRTVGLDDLVSDATSPALEIAAFGRMFANQTNLGTHAAVAVSHATTTHPMALTTDYFSAVEDAIQEHAGAGHIGMTYYTSGVYYRSFTIELEQLKRSWASFSAEGARDDFASMVRALVRALPTGKVNNSNAHTLPTTVLAEVQDMRVAYEFETPLQPAEGGGYKEATVRSLAAQRRQALRFDAPSFGPAFVAGDTLGEDFAAEQGDLAGLVEFIVSRVFDGEQEQAESEAGAGDARLEAH